MLQNAIMQIGFFVIVLLLCIKPLGDYMARVYEMKSCGLSKILGPLERFFYRVGGVNPLSEMTWKQYFLALMCFNFIGFVVLFLMLMFQSALPWNPQNFPGLSWQLALNTAMSFVSNTNWQAYGGETTMSYFSDMLGLTVQNFLSAATGMAVLAALIRGFSRRETPKIGNFWVDLIRSALYILLPLSIIWSVLLMSQGVIQNLSAYIHTSTQVLPMGPAASQVAIKVLGTNGGGFFNVNGAHPFENPTPFSNFLEMLALLVIPAALCQTFGRMVRDTRQGLAVLIVMMVLFVPALFLTTYLEQTGNSALQDRPLDMHVLSGDVTPGGNMEGKEMRFGITDSAMYAVATTASSNGSVNSSLDSFTPQGGMIPMFLMQVGAVVFGGVGSGLYGLLVKVIITVFIAGLMVGRTPEYLGKKVEAFEMKMASIIIFMMPALVLLGTAIACLNPLALKSLGNGGAHGFSELLYAMTSFANNNGSAFAGLNANTSFFNIVGTIVIAMGRYGVMIPVLAIAGSLAQKKNIPVGPGTLPTHSGFFIGLVVAVIVVIGGLTFIPALSLGPIVEQLQMTGALS